MRWIKHLAMAHNDQAMSAILEDLGPDAYGVYWLLVELIAAVMDRDRMTPDLIHSDVKWAQITHCSARRFRSITQRLAQEKLIVCESIGNRLKISIPKILKYKDEYSQKSRHSPEIRVETDTDREQIENITPIAEKTPATATAPEALILISSGSAETAKAESAKPDRFEEFWTLYPRKVGKTTAHKTWRRKADSVSAAEEIIFGLKAHMTALLQKDLEYRPYAATWLNQERWKDQVEQREPKPTQQRNGRYATAETPNYPAAVVPSPDKGVSIEPMKIIRNRNSQ